MKVLLIGANGFLGENLTKFLSKIDSVELSVYDLQLKDSIKQLCPKFIEDDLLNIQQHEDFILQQEFIIHLAGVSGAVSSFNKIELFNQVNVLGLVKLLEIIRKGNSKIKLIFPSSRLVYSDQLDNPIHENDLTLPSTIYGVNKLACEGYLRSYNKMYDIDFAILRISIPFGYQAALNANHGIINNFIFKAINDDDITIFGEGDQIRDVIFIDDFLEIILSVLNKFDLLKNEIYNLGGTYKYSIKTIAQTVVKIFNSGTVKTVEWPEDYKKIETGSAYLDSSKLYDKLEKRPEYDLDSAILQIKSSIENE